jgi:hypothetical protein
VSDKTEDESNVVDIKTKEKKDKPAKPKVADIYMNIKAAFERSPASCLPKFDKEIYFMISDSGVRTPVEVIEGKQVKYVAEEYVVAEILQYCHYRGAYSGMTHAEAVSCYKFIKDMVVPFSATIKPVAQLSEECYTWRRLPFDLASGEFPTFTEMLSRMDVPVSVLAWIGSLLVKEADQQQYLWIHGDGQDGKGRLAKFLRTALGLSYKGEQVPDQGARRFWTHGLLGKRLICFADCSEYSFTRSGFFKSLTGGDSQRIEEKGKTAYDAELDAKFLFLSQETPDISRSKADTRRALYVEMKPMAQDTKVIPAPVYDDLLWSEASPFLHKCLEVYNKLCPSHGPIPLSKKAMEKIDSIVEHGEEGFHSILDRGGFEIVEIPFIPTGPSEGIKMHDLPYVSPSRLQNLIHEERLDKNHKKSFMNWLRLKGVDRKRVRLEHGREWRYLGMKELNSEH